MIYFHDIADTKHRADIHHIMFSLDDNGITIEYFLFFDGKRSVLIRVIPFMSEHTDRKFLDVFLIQFMLIDYFVSDKIMLASIEKIEFRIFVIFESIMPIDMIGIDIQQHADIIVFFEPFQHVA